MEILTYPHWDNRICLPQRNKNKWHKCVLYLCCTSSTPFHNIMWQMNGHSWLSLCNHIFSRSIIAVREQGIIRRKPSFNYHSRHTMKKTSHRQRTVNGLPRRVFIIIKQFNYYRVVNDAFVGTDLSGSTSSRDTNQQNTHN